MESKHTLRNSIYAVCLFFITLSGFAQMPIFKRYYIADIPGLGWLAKFYVTHIIHYAAAVVLIALVVYVLFDFILNRSGRVTGSGYFKTVVLGVLIVTGGLMAVKNLPTVHFGHKTIIALDLTHLGFCMVFLGASLYTLIRKKKWVH